MKGKRLVVVAVVCRVVEGKSEVGWCKWKLTYSKKKKKKKKKKLKYI